MENSFPPAPAELLDDFEDLADWEDRYEYILDLGRELPEFDSSLQTAENRVSGCMSTVWLVVDQPAVEGAAAESPIVIRADSDSMIVRGLIAILLALYEGKSPEEAVAVDPAPFLGKLGLNQHLSPNRRNGLYSMVSRIRELCVRLVAAA